MQFGRRGHAPSHQGRDGQGEDAGQHGDSRPPRPGQRGAADAGGDGGKPAEHRGDQRAAPSALREAPLSCFLPDRGGPLVEAGPEERPPLARQCAQIVNAQRVRRGDAVEEQRDELPLLRPQRIDAGAVQRQLAGVLPPGAEQAPFLEGDDTGGHDPTVGQVEHRCRNLPLADTVPAPEGSHHGRRQVRVGEVAVVLAFE